MKKFILFTFILTSILSCSQKKGAKGTFKLIVGNSAISVPLNGGAFVETEDIATSIKSLIPLDADNSAVIPTGSYNMLFVAFQGPNQKSGKMYCGQVQNAALTNATATISVSITEAHCSDPIYTDLITKLIGNSSWDSAKFDQGKWGP